WFFDVFGLAAPRRAGSETLRLWLHTRLPQPITSVTFFKESSAGAVAHRSRGWSRAQPSARREQKPSGTMVGARMCHPEKRSAEGSPTSEIAQLGEICFVRRFMQM